MDISKAFDCIPHDFLIAKLNAHRFNKKALTYLYSYLKRKKQSVKINHNEKDPKDLFLNQVFSLKKLILRILQMAIQYMCVERI